jgi:thioredoxin-like negative regulator of GroEL
MQPLTDHKQFEELYENNTLGAPVLVYFTADWCGACKRIDWEFIEEEFPNLKIYRCDIDENKYTPGFCQIRSIPNFIMVNPGHKNISGPYQNSETAKIASWIQVQTRKNTK